jgi:hypothetical protein
VLIGECSTAFSPSPADHPALFVETTDGPLGSAAKLINKLLFANESFDHRRLW